MKAFLIPRRRTPLVTIGPITIGAGTPIAIQSMTNTDTTDIAATIEQIQALHQAGASIIRLTINHKEAAKSFVRLKEKLLKYYQKLPFALVGDFHFNGHQILKSVPACAAALDKLRINPGNATDKGFLALLEIAKKHQKPIRIGVNGGSIDPKILESFMEENAKKPRPESSETVRVKAAIHSALQSASIAESMGIKSNRIVLSIKFSKVPSMVQAYRILAEKTPYCLHLGLTEAGSGIPGITSSSIALGILLAEGIGDTIRVSITPESQKSRTQEVEVCKAILQSLELQRFHPHITACPGCGRTDNTVFQHLVKKIKKALQQKLPQWEKTYPFIKNLNIAIMGCVVNGPGESAQADIAISLPGKTEKAQIPIYLKGHLYQWIKPPHIAEQFLAILEKALKEGLLTPKNPTS